MTRILLRCVAFIALVTTTALIFMLFACAKSCKSHPFSSRGGLVRHQNSCSIYKTAAALRTERRQAPRKVPPHTSAQLNPQQYPDIQNPINLGLDTVRAQALLTTNSLVNLLIFLAKLRPFFDRRRAMPSIPLLFYTNRTAPTQCGWSSPETTSHSTTI